MRIGSVYLAYDVEEGTGNNAAAPAGQPNTQAIYGNPACNLVVDPMTGVISGPNFGTCSLDVGLESSAGVTIADMPDYLDLAQSATDVQASLDAGTFAVAPGSYSWVRMDIGSNAIDAPGNGSVDSLPEGTAMNVRFDAEGMDEPYEVRRLTGTDAELAAPLVVAAGDEITVELKYDVSGAVYSVPEADGSDKTFCTAATGDPALNYCVEVSAMNLMTVVTVNGTVLE
jgi:hypothetical protein